MPQDQSVQAKGLFTNPNYLSVPEGALSIADNVVISRPGVIEPRRGYEIFCSGTASNDPTSGVPEFQSLIYWDREIGPRTLAFKGNPTVPSSHFDYGVIDSTGSFHFITTVPNALQQVNSLATNGNLYFTHHYGVNRQSGDPLSGTIPLGAGVIPANINFISASVPGTGAAIASDTQVAYRAVWWFVDESGLKHQGPPSGRSIFVNRGIQYSPGQMAVVSGTASITPTGGHPFVSGDMVYIGDGQLEPNIPNGDYICLSGTNSGTFKINLGNGLNFSNSQIHRIGYAARYTRVVVQVPGEGPGFAARSGGLGMYGLQQKLSGTGAGYYFQLYRSPASTNSDVDADDNVQLVWESQIVAAQTGCFLSRSANNSPYVTCTFPNNDSPYLVNDSIQVISTDQTFYPQGAYVVTSASTSSLIYFDGQVGLTKILGPTGTICPWTLSVIDSINDGLAGAALYSNPNQDGIIQSKFAPPAAQDVALYKNSMFYANTVSPHRADVTLGSVWNGSISGPSLPPAPPPDGNDQLFGYDYPGMTLYLTGVLNGVPWTLHYCPAPPTSASIYEPGLPSGIVPYPVYDGAVFNISPAESVSRTAQALCAAINRDWNNFFVRAYYTSDSNDVPGKITLESKWVNTSATDNQFTAAMWRFFPQSLSSSVDAWPNGLFYSRTSEFEAVPLLNFFRVGENDKPIQRIIALQNALVVIKEDGIFRVVGDQPSNFRVEVLDNTVNCIAPQSAVSMNNKIYMLTQYGVVECTEQGIQVISAPIDDQFKNLVATVGRDTILSRSFGVADPEDRKYKLWVPSSTGDVNCDSVFTYDFYTSAWTTWTVPATCGVVDKAHHRVLLGDWSGSYRERRDGYYTDFADYIVKQTGTLATGTGTFMYSLAGVTPGQAIVPVTDDPLTSSFLIVGDVSGNYFNADFTAGTNPTGSVYKIYQPISSNIDWSPNTGGNIGGVNQLREVGFAFRQGNFGDNTVSASFRGDIATNVDYVPVSGKTKYQLKPLQWNNGPQLATDDNFRIRVGIPRNSQRASELIVDLNLKQAFNWFQIQAMIATLNQVSEKMGKR